MARRLLADLLAFTRRLLIARMQKDMHRVKWLMKQERAVRGDGVETEVSGGDW